MANAVAIKLPTFWTSCPSAWFAQTEAQFALRDITKDETKYYHVVASLDAATATRAVPILTAPPATDKYNAIKTFLTTSFELSEDERAAALCNLPGLGDYKPSELLDNMLNLLGDHTPCFLFKHLFLRQLPDYVRSPLATSSQTNYRLLAQEADKIHASRSKYHQQEVQEVNSTNNTNTPNYTPRFRIINNLCYYHYKFDNKAMRCVKGCKHYANFKQNQGNDQKGHQ